MCGIIGYTSKSSGALNVAVDCLKNLEYRGYDSSGVATVENNAIKVYKATGKIKNLESKLSKNNIETSTTIAHTRWATHGEPCEVNAHPHKTDNVALVHNGIIENHTKLRNKLFMEGYKFSSDTDTEIAVSYIDYMTLFSSSNIEAVSKACKDFEGSFAFGILFNNKPNTIYATRKSSPLIIGIAKDGNFIASDVSAILNYTNKYILLEDYEIAKVTKDSVEIYDANLNLVEKEILTATWDTTKYQKDGYDHFMLKEIYEQPEVLSMLFDTLHSIKNDIDFKVIEEIHIIACGSAMHAGMVGKYLFENFANIKTTVEIASEYRYKQNFISPSTLVIIISQSGETADTLAALRLANKHTDKTLAIVNVVGSSIAREAKKVVYTNAGPEIAVATTKGYTSQIAVLDKLVLLAMKQKNIISYAKLEEVYNSFINFRNIANCFLSNSSCYLDIAKKLYTHDYAFFIGRGIDYASSMEGSLKLKEISYIHSEAYAAGELKHGTISLIEKGTIVFAIATDDKLLSKTISNLKETKARGAHTIIITTEKLKDSVKNSADDTILVPYLNEFTTPIFVAFVLQLIAYETAKLRKTDIDKPKNLAKSVTVE